MSTNETVKPDAAVETAPAPPPDAAAAAGAAPETRTPPASPPANGAANEQGKPQDGGTIFDGLDKPETETAAAKPDWPGNWRELAAGGDEKLAKVIARYQSPAGLAKALANAQDMIRSGELKRGMPKDGSAEDIAKWRKEAGLPEKPEGYTVPKVPGFEIDEGHPTMASFKEVAFRANMAPEQFQEIASWYANTLRAVEEQRFSEDRQARVEVEEALRSEWGPEYRANITLADRFLSTELGDRYKPLMEARMPDGRRVGDDPSVIRFMAKMATEMDGGVGLIRGDATTAKDIDARLSELTAMMNSTDANKRALYWSEKIQSEERELYARKERLRARAA